MNLRLLRSLAVLLLLLPSLQRAVAQSGRIVTVGYAEGPDGSRHLDFYLFDAQGIPVRDPRPGWFLLASQQQSRSITSIECDKSTATASLSSLVALDVSSSMLNSDRLDRAKRAAQLWFALLPLGVSDGGLLSFNHDVQLLSDLTTDRDRLLGRLERLEPWGGTSYNAALLTRDYGALDLVARGERKRVVLFLTDGISPVDVTEVVRRADRDSIVVHVILIDLDATDDLRRIADETGGMLFDRVSTIAEVEAIFHALLLREQGIEPCRLTWRDPPTCLPTANLTIAVPSLAIDTTFDFARESAWFPDVVAEAPAIDFRDRDPSAWTGTATFLSSGAELLVEGVEIVGDGAFSLVETDPTLPARLRPGQRLVVSVMFDGPTDQLHRSRLQVVSNSCRSSGVSLVGGEGMHSIPIRLVSPNGGERFRREDPVVIEWDGVTEATAVTIDFSTDDGRSWQPVIAEARGGRFSWRAGRTANGSFLSDSCRIRVRPAQIGDSSGSRRIATNERVWVVASDPVSGATAAGGDNGSLLFVEPQRGTIFDDLSGQIDGNIRELDFSESGELLLVATGGGSLRMYDRGDRLWREFRHQDGLRSGAFATGDRQIIATTTRGAIVGLDRATGAILWERDAGDDVSPIDLRASGSFIVGTNGAQALTFDQRNGWLIDRRDNAGALVERADIHPSVSDIATVLDGVDGPTLERYSLADRQSTAHYPLPGAPSEVRYHPDGIEVAVGFHAIGNRTVLPSVQIQALQGTNADRALYVPVQPNGPRSVRSIAWGPDGRYLSIAQADSNLTIWDLFRTSFGSDVSDAPFSVIDDPPKTTAINVGTVYVGSVHDTLVNSVLLNGSRIPLQIDSITVDGPSFSLRSRGRGRQVSAETGLDLEIGFAPDVPGVHNGTLRFFRGDITDTVPVTGTGRANDVMLHQQVVNFGSLELGKRVDSLVTLLEPEILRRLQSVRAISIAMAGSSPFRIDGSAVQIDPTASEPLEISVVFDPQRIGRFHEVVRFEILDASGDPVPGEFRLVLAGEAVCPVDRLDAPYVPDLVAEVGHVVTVPVFVPGERPTDGTPVSFVLSYDHTLLVPVDSALVSREDGDRRETFVVGSLGATNEPVAEIRMWVALGRTDTTSIAIRYAAGDLVCFAASDDSDGVLNIDGICREGGGRFFHSNANTHARLAIDPPIPNPLVVDGTIDFSTVESGPVQVDIVDALGGRRTIFFVANSDPGSWSIPIHRSDLAAGHYIIRLRTATQERTITLVVQ